MKGDGGFKRVEENGKVYPPKPLEPFSSARGQGSDLPASNKG